MTSSQYRRILSSSSMWDVLHNAVKSIDSFGEPISLTYQGDNYSRSAFGGFMTLVGQILAVVYMSYQLAWVFQRGNVRLSYSSLRIDLNDFGDSPPMNLSTDNFNFAINVHYVGSDPSVQALLSQTVTD